MVKHVLLFFLQENFLLELIWYYCLFIWIWSSENFKLCILKKHIIKGVSKLRKNKFGINVERILQHFSLTLVPIYFIPLLYPVLLFNTVTPHCWGHHDQKVDTKAKFYVIWFIMINALIWCNFEKNWLGSFWDNPIYPIVYPHGQDLEFFERSKFFYSYPTLLYCVMAIFPL